ncbi:MAG: SDR family NAD(P)-dependent oxidoreductase [Microscillaceae bacterium]|nr:SDR family NAD(P)-dependent oxidoreductase [Microscillaceae bacterium]MDW8459824.1 SDR family NAD(P)-dependent oxidoreductase [Cytophagales bacterium]
MLALVTGSARGLGKAMIEYLAQQGYEVIIHYAQSYQEARALKEKLQTEGKKAHCIQADLSQPAQVQAMFHCIKNEIGELDVLVNNVGNYLKKNIQEISPTEWQSIINTNLHSTFYCCREAIQVMKSKKRGKIVNIGFSMVGQFTAQPNITPYLIAKTGVWLLTKALAKELAPYNVQVNMLSPGVLENSLSQPLHEIPSGRVGTFAEFNHALNFLLSPQSNYITGTHLEVAGGWRL